MRVFLLFYTLGIGICFSSNSYSQSTKLSLNLKNKTVKQFFSEIEKSSEFIFFYQDDIIDVNRRVTVNTDNETIEQILNQVLNATGNTYFVSDRSIYIIKKDLESVVYEKDIFQQKKKTITGTITGKDGESIIGANIVEIGTTNGTVTDIDGKFSLNVEEDAILRISYIGYLEQEISTLDATIINLVLEEDTRIIDELVVVGYGIMKKSDLTGSVVSANLDAFKESPNISIMQSLQNSVPGISIGQINQAGQEPSIEVRGVSTLSGTRSPLIVVDGIIFNGRFNDINPSDVESVEVLKDPSSKAIYGSQAANGIILITTKTGKKGEKPIFTYSGSFTSSTPTVNARLLNRDEYLQKVKDIEWRNAYTAESGYTELNPEWDYTLSEAFAQQLAGIDNGTYFDWWDAATQTALLKNHMLGVSGGSQKTNFYMSAGYTEQAGHIKNNDYSRWTARVNFDTEITEWLTLGSNISGAFTDFSGDSPTISRLSSATTPVSMPWDENGEMVLNPTGMAHVNPLLTSFNDRYSVQNRFVGNFFAIIQVPWVKGLSYRINNGYNVKFFKDYYSSIYDSGQIGLAEKANAYQYEQTLDHIINYTKQLGKNSINATLVYGFNKINYERTAASGSGYSNLTLSYNNLGLGTTQNIASSAWEEASLYQMARLGYTYDGKYLFTGTLRRDGFSGFAQNNKTALFPSIGLGWIISEERFLNDSFLLSYLKVRGSYGVNGNKVGRYSSLARVTAGGSSNYVFGDGSATYIGQSPTSLANNELKWEKTNGINLGIDFGFLKNRIGGNIDYYRTTTKDLLWNMVLPRTSGFSSVTSNIGELRNSGLEFMIEGNPVQTASFNWDIGITFSRNKNTVVKLLGEDVDGDGKEDDLIASGLFIGHSIGAIYGYEVDGIWQVDDDRPAGFDPGSFRIVDQNGDGEITAADDRKIIGYTEPAYRLGIQNTLKYKQFGLQIFISSIQGGKNGYMAENYPTGYMNTKGNATNSNWFNFYDYWAPTRPNAKYPNPWVATPVSGSREYFQRNFIRLQDISLSYTIDKDLLKYIGVQDAKLYISGKNLLTFTNWDGWDPETGQGITSTNAYPVMKSYSFGIELSF